MPSIDDLRAALADAGFGGAVETGPAMAAVYGTDNSIYQLRPAAAVVPQSVDDLRTLASVNHALAAPFPLVARGGGTGTNGQSLTEGVVVDVRRAMNRIVSIDADARTAVVEPGVVLDRLNARLRPAGLFFAPHTSTATRCTIGGMVSTDAAGKGSLVHGRTSRHVAAIDAVLADGTPWRADRPADRPDRHPDAAVRGVRDGLVAGRIAEIERDVRAALAGLDRSSFPDVPRGFTGYDLAGAATPDGIDPVALLCGSEGTLALLGPITLRLTPLSGPTRLVVAAYPTFEGALRDAGRLTATRPSAIECLDAHTISLAHDSPAWPAVAGLLDLRDRAVLLLEYDAATADDVRDLVSGPNGPTTWVTTVDPVEIAAIWQVRSDAVGVLGRAVGGRRSIPFVEDCAVPPHRLDEFVSEFRALLDGHGLGYGMFGHADVGCIHVRPALDLYDPTHEALVRTITDRVAELVTRAGGVLWGEHGRGFRGEYLDLPPETVHRMRLVKTAFDPANLLNPGKLYTPLADAPDVTPIDAVPLRVHRDRTVAPDQRAEYASAFDCNGNGICHHWGATEVMCPSFKVTLDPQLSPKGRADLTRAWLAAPDDRVLADSVADSMRQCLSCGACTGRCPLHVDIPELKSRFLERHADRSVRRRARTALLSRLEPSLPLVQRAATIVGPLQRLAAPVLDRVLGIVDLPTVPPTPSRPAVRSGSGRARRAGGVRARADLDEATVVIVPDAFTAFLEPAVLEATMAVLHALGERPAVAPFVPSGKYDHVTGRRRRFATTVARQRDLLDDLRHRGAEVVAIEPAVALLAHHEYRAIDPTFPADMVHALPDVVDARLDRLPRGPVHGAALLFTHCTETSLTPATTGAYRRMLEAAGYEVTVEPTSCCGMAGIFGHEAEHRPMSAALFESSWRTPLGRPAVDRRCVSGWSCRSQARRFGFADVVHPIQVLAAHVGTGAAPARP